MPSWTVTPVPSAHKHRCPHGTWTCHADGCKPGPGACGTCLKLRPHDPDVACTRCGNAVEPARRGRYVPLCEACSDLIGEQLEKGKFLG